MGWTIASAILTAISIIFSIISIIQAKKAKQYKDEVINLKYAIEVKGITDKFTDAHLKFLQETRSENWNKGKNINSVIAPMESALTAVAKVYPLMDDARELKRKVHKISVLIRRFDECNKIEKKDTFEELGEIDNILQEVLHEQTAKAVK